jgi:hypothetical protein
MPGIASQREHRLDRPMSTETLERPAIAASAAQFLARLHQLLIGGEWRDDGLCQGVNFNRPA